MIDREKEERLVLSISRNVPDWSKIPAAPDGVPGSPARWWQGMVIAMAINMLPRCRTPEEFGFVCERIDDALDAWITERERKRG